MQKVIKLTDKIPRVDINHYLAASGELSRVCVLSEKDVTIIRSYLFPGVEWETRFIRPLGGDNYQTGTTEEFSEYLETLNELDYRLSGGLSMSLENALTEIANAIEALASANSSVSVQNIVRAISTSNVCCEQAIINQGGGVIGRTTQPGSEEEVPIFGTQDPIGVPSGTFPEGYDSEEEYLLDKCQISNLIIDGVIGTLRNLGAFGVFNGVALAGLIVTAIVGIIVFPPAFIPIAAACIGFLSVEVTLLALAADHIQENREQWVCAIYNSEGTEEAIAVLADLIDAMISAIGTSGGVGFWIKQIVLLLCNADTINQAMQNTAHINYPDADCSGCGSEVLSWQPCTEVLSTTLEIEDIVGEAQCGTVNSNVYGAVVFVGVYDNGGSFPYTSDENTYTVAIDVTSGAITDPYSSYGYHPYNYVAKDNTILYEGDTPQPTLACRNFQIYSSTPFTVTLTFTLAE